jgi:hypothetical protein
MVAYANSPVSIIRWTLFWIGKIARSRVLFWAIAAGVTAYDVFLLTGSLGRSLWQDEAFVANSVIAKTVDGIFYPHDWLQSTPPLLLILARAVVLLFGLSNTTLRVVPVSMGILAIGTMLFFAVRILWRQYALLAWTMVVLSPIEITYARQLKQYSSEFFVSTAILLACSLYMEKTSARRFWLLVATTAGGLLVGYGIALLVPAVALLIWMFPSRTGSSSSLRARLSSPFARAVVFAAITGATVLSEYRVFCIPNGPEVQHTAFAKKNAGKTWGSLATSESYQFIGEIPLNHRFDRTGIRLSSAAILLLIGLILSWKRFRHGRREWFAIQVVCLLPCLTLLVCDHFVLYPFTERTSLFLLPLLVTALVSSLQLISLFLFARCRGWLRPLFDVLILMAIALTLIASRAKNFRQIDPGEDADGAVSFLQAHVQPQDFLWVHSSLSQHFKLYVQMHQWMDAPAHFGNTGWPCCSRGIPDTKYTSSEPLVREDFGRALDHFSGRVWVLYTMRPEHWSGFADEPAIMRTILHERGCTETPTPAFFHVGLDAFDCGANAARESQTAPSLKLP